MLAQKRTVLTYLWTQTNVHTYCKRIQTNTQKKVMTKVAASIVWPVSRAPV